MNITADRSQHRLSAGMVGWSSKTRRWADRESTVVIAHPVAVSATSFLDDAVDELAAECHTDLAACPALGLVMLLFLWDNEFRASGLYDANIYLSSAESLAVIASQARWTAPVLVDVHALDGVLVAMAEAELLYQFPVAAKFRGEFGPDRQLRLNCWGRKLAERVIRGDMATDRTETARLLIRRHLERHHDRYRQHMKLLEHLADKPAGAAWDSARTLPVGVLV